MKKLFILLFLVSNVFAEEVIKSSTALADLYLCFPSTWTTTNKNTVLNSLLKVANFQGQPSARYHANYNSDNSISKFTDYRDSTIKLDTSTTRMTIMVAVAYRSVFAPFITAGRAKKLGTLYETVYDDTKTGRKNLRGVKYMPIVDYEMVKDNKDWCLKTFTVDTSTH